ncbi:MAG: hypothetical protein HY719_16025 [Planctomycetes bacterium]|nr:hypothetical protein [Planctomycetota bacterium]
MATESPGPPGTPTRLSARLTDLYARKAVELGFCAVRQALAAVHARQRDPDGPTIDRLFVALGILSEAQAEDVRLAVRAVPPLTSRKPKGALRAPRRVFYSAS